MIRAEAANPIAKPGIRFQLRRSAKKNEPQIKAAAAMKNDGFKKKVNTQMTPLDTPPAGEIKRLGFMPGINVPDDFDTMFQDEIEKMFYGDK